MSELNGIAYSKGKRAGSIQFLKAHEEIDLPGEYNSKPTENIESSSLFSANPGCITTFMKGKEEERKIQTPRLLAEFFMVGCSIQDSCGTAAPQALARVPHYEALE